MQGLQQLQAERFRERLLHRPKHIERALASPPVERREQRVLGAAERVAGDRKHVAGTMHFQVESGRTLRVEPQ